MLAQEVPSVTSQPQTKACSRKQGAGLHFIQHKTQSDCPSAGQQQIALLSNPMNDLHSHKALTV